MKEIKIVPYEDKEKHCSEFYLIWANKDSKAIKLEIISNALRDLTNLREIKKLIEILETIEINALINKQKTLIIGNTYIELETAK